MIDELSSNDIWCIDGTFKVVPRPYFQLYTISYIKNNHVFPSIFCLTKNKKKETYLNIIEIIKQMKPNLYPRIIKSDFEYASITAFKESFLNVTISGCQFHLGKKVQRKLGEYGLTMQFRHSPLIKKYVKSLICLSYVRIDKVIETFNEIAGDHSFPIILKTLYDYFFENYVNQSNNTRYPLEFWHASYAIENNIPRTNNAIEGWHNVFNSSFNNYKYSFIKLAKSLKDEEDIIRIKKIRLDLGHNLPRKKKYIDNEFLLNNFLNENNNRNYGRDFVFELASLIFY